MKKLKGIIQNLRSCMCFVDVYAGPYPDIPFTYNAFFIYDNEHIATYAQGFYEKANKIEIRFPDVEDVVTPIETFHDKKSGITIFRVLPLETYRPLEVDLNTIYKPGKKCFIPQCSFYDPVYNLFSGQIEMVMDVKGNILYQSSHEIEFRELGCPLLDSNGTVIGLVTKEYNYNFWDEYELDIEKDIKGNGNYPKKYRSVERSQKRSGSLAVVLSAKHIDDVFGLCKVTEAEKKSRKMPVLTA